MTTRLISKMVGQLEWLGQKDEVQFGKNKFTGKMAGKAWKYSQNLDRLIKIRALLFLTSFLVFYPIITNYVFHDLLNSKLAFERAIYSFILLVAGLLFNRFRVMSILLSLFPLVLMLTTYLTVEGQFNIRKIGFAIVAFVLVLSGIYHHFKLKSLRRELEINLVDVG